MMFQGRHVWRGFSGRHYYFSYYSMRTLFEQVPAVYIFAKFGKRGWLPVHVGETLNLQATITKEFKQPYVEAGATHLHIRRMKDEPDYARTGLARDIKDSYPDILGGIG